MMKRVFIFFIAILFLLFGCRADVTSDEVDLTKQRTQIEMPDNMPDDFHFSVKFGIYKNNEINTFDHTVTKDLIEDGTVTTDLTLSNEEMEEIYGKMKALNIMENKNLTADTNCMQEPHEEDEWIISLNGESIRHYYTEKNCELTYDAKQLMELRNDIFRIVKSKDEYKDLPEASGGYD